MTAIFRIDQAGHSTKPSGDPGIARQDLELFSEGGTVTLVALDSHTIYTWTLISAPEGSTAILTPSGNTATIDIDVTGGYIFQLVVDALLETEDVLGLYGGVPLQYSQLAIPAFNETVQDNSEYGGIYGYERKLTRYLKYMDQAIAGADLWSRDATTDPSNPFIYPAFSGDIVRIEKLEDSNRPGSAYTTVGMPLSANQAEWDTFVSSFGDGTSLIGAFIASAGSGVFEEGAGTDSTQRVGVGNDASGDYAFATGASAVASGAYAIAMGGGVTASDSSAVAIGSGITASGAYSFAAGTGGEASGDHSVAFGTSHTLSGAFSATFGGTNAISAPYALVHGANNNLFSGATHSFVSGGDNDVKASYSGVVGNSNLVEAGGAYAFVQGWDNKVMSATYVSVFGGRHRFKSSAGTAIFGNSNHSGLWNQGTGISLTESGGTMTLTDDFFPFGGPYWDTPGGFSITISGSTSGNDGTYGPVTKTGLDTITFAFAGTNESGNPNLRWEMTAGGSGWALISGEGNAAFNTGGQDGIIAGRSNSVYNGGAIGSLVVGRYHNLYGGSVNHSVIFGENHTCGSSGTRSLLGGQYNTIGDGVEDSIVVGEYCESKSGATLNVVTGRQAAADQHKLMHIHSGGNPQDSSDTALTGQAQLLGSIPMSGYTTDATPTNLYLDGAKQSLAFTTLSGHAYVLVTYVIAKAVGGPSFEGLKSWKLETTIDNTGSSARIIGTPVKTLIHSTLRSGSGQEDEWDVNVATDGSSFHIEVTGAPGDQIRWVSYSMGPEVGFST